MIPAANSADIDRLKAAADLIEEVDELTTYLGFCQPGTTSEEAAQWAICKITQSGTEYPILTSSKWAGGFCMYNLKWTDRALYEYSYKKF